MLSAVGRGCLLIAILHVSLSDGSTTISPSPSLQGKEGQLVSAVCNSTVAAGNLFYQYDGVDSVQLSAVQGEENRITVTTQSGVEFHVETVGLTSVLTYAAVQLNFNLSSEHDGGTLRCKFVNNLGVSTLSESLKLTVLSAPCCNATPPTSTSYNTTDLFSLLNCSEIVIRPGNPAASVQWKVIPSNSGCTGTPQGNLSELYEINPIGRICNNVAVECMAENTIGLTKKLFNLVVKSPPERPDDCNSNFTDRNHGALFTWNETKEDGDFNVTNYDIIVYVNDVIRNFKISKSVSVKANIRAFTFADGKDGEFLKFSVSASNVLGNGPNCTSDLRIPYRKCITPTLQSKTRRYLIINCRTIPGGDQMGRYTAYYSGNGLMNSTVSLNLPIVISMLAEDTSYEIAVEALNSVGQLENSTTVTFTTNPPGPPAMPTVADTSVQAKSVSSITLTFPSVQDAGQDNATVTKYNVYVNEEPRNFPAQPGNTQTFVIMHLDDDTQYTISVSAVNNLDKEGQRSDSIKIRTVKKEGGGLSGGVIAGIIVAIIVLIVVVIILVVYFKSRSSNEEPSGGGEAPKDENDKPRKKEPKEVKPKKPVDPDAVMYADLDLGKAGKAPAKEASQYSEARACKTSEYADLDHTERSAEDEKKNMKKVKKKKEEQGVSYTGVKLAEEDE